MPPEAVFVYLMNLQPWFYMISKEGGDKTNVCEIEYTPHQQNLFEILAFGSSDNDAL